MLTKVATITGSISPKSVVASQTGLFFAQNMMYRHTITVYDRSYQLVETITDTVVLADFGHDDYEGEYRGSPVEAAFTSDSAYVYVSNYRMYGGGLSTVAGDGCNAGSWPDSFVYRIDTTTLEIDQIIKVGPVPKFLAVTPDDRYLLVSNWCGFDVSIIDIALGEEIARIPVGRHPKISQSRLSKMWGGRPAIWCSAPMASFSMCLSTAKQSWPRSRWQLAM